MASIETLTNDNAALKPRRDAALSALARRAGVAGHDRYTS
jgi:hypothetical protein